MRTTTKTTIRPTVGNSVSRDASLAKKKQSGPTSSKEKMTNERYTPSKLPTTKTKAKPTSVGNSVSRDASLAKKKQSGPTSSKEKMTNERYTPSKTTIRPTSMGNSASRGRIK